MNTPQLPQYVVRDKHTLEGIRALRQRLLTRGYEPLPAEDKRVMMKGWPQIEVTEALIDEWAESANTLTTAIRISGDLVAIDIDINDLAMVESVFLLLDEINPGIVRDAPMRYGGGDKVMLLCQCPGEKFGIARSAVFEHGEDNHVVEVFGSLSARYFTCFGPHTSGEVSAEGLRVHRWYRFAEGATPLDTDPDQLPVVTRDEMVRFTTAATALLEQSGWDRLKRSKVGLQVESRLADVDPEARYHMQDGSVVSYDDLAGRLGERCSASFIEDGAVNTSRCIVNNHFAGIVGVFETAGYATHFPVGTDLDVRKKIKDGEQRGSALKLGQLLADRGEALESSSVEYRKPTTSDLLGTDGRDLDEYEFLDWLVATHAFHPSGSSEEKVINLINGEALSLASFHDLWNDKTFEVETGEEFTKGPRAGEGKTEIVVPTKVWHRNRDGERINIGGYQYRPQEPGVKLVGGGHNALPRYNEYVSPVRPDVEACAGARQWWDDFMVHLLPDDIEREWYENWMRVLWQRPHVRGQGVVMVSPDGGSGRGILFSLLKHIHGRAAKAVSSGAFTGTGSQSQYNDWGRNCVLVTVAELLVGVSSYKDREAGYERIKELIEPGQDVQMFTEKFVKSREGRAYFSFLGATNNIAAIPIKPTDRRITVLSNGPRLYSRDALVQRYLQFVRPVETGDVTDGAMAAIIDWMEEVPVTSRDVVRMGETLDTDAKLAMIEGAEGYVEPALRNVLRKLAMRGVVGGTLTSITEAVYTEIASTLGRTPPIEKGRIKVEVRQLTAPTTGFEAIANDARSAWCFKGSYRYGFDSADVRKNVILTLPYCDGTVPLAERAKLAAQIGHDVAQLEPKTA